MKRNYVKYTSGAILTGLILFTSCQSTREVQANYEVVQIEGTRICMDSTWDAHPDEKAAALLKPYKEKIDKMMYEVIGVSEMTMDKGRPESLLSNLVAEVLRLSAERVLKHPADIGIWAVCATYFHRVISQSMLFSKYFLLKILSAY